MRRSLVGHCTVFFVLLCSPFTTFSAESGCPELLQQKDAQSVSHSASLDDIFQSPAVREIVRDGVSMQVLADLLLERGHSYGEFLSLWAEWQQELNRVGSARTSSLREKAYNSFNRNIRSWMPEGIPDSVRTVIFREDGQIRGLVLDRRLQEFVSHGGIEFMQALKMDTLEIVDSGRILIPGVPELSLLAGFSKVKTLRTLLLDSRNLQGMAGLPELALFTQLEALGLRTAFPPAPDDHAVLMESIAKMTHLKALLLEGVPLWGRVGSLSPLKELTEIGFSFAEATQNDLTALGQFTKLQKVVLNQVNYVSDVEWTDLPHARDAILPPLWVQQEMRAVLERQPLLREFQVRGRAHPSNFSRQGMVLSETADWNIGRFPNRSEQWEYGFNVPRFWEMQSRGYIGGRRIGNTFAP